MITTNESRGSSSEMSLRLCSRAPETTIELTDAIEVSLLTDSGHAGTLQLLAGWRVCVPISARLRAGGRADFAQNAVGVNSREGVAQSLLCLVKRNSATD